MTRYAEARPLMRHSGKVTSKSSVSLCCRSEDAYRKKMEQERPTLKAMYDAVRNKDIEAAKRHLQERINQIATTAQDKTKYNNHTTPEVR